MTEKTFEEKLTDLIAKQRKLVEKKNNVDETWYNGLFNRYENPVVTAEHLPIFWRFDLNKETNPYLIERNGINAALNPGAIYLNGKIYLMVRTEGYDRKSFFALAESENGVDNFRFHDYPIVMPETDDPDVNVYDMRMIQHEDGWIYGLFCTERKDPKAPAGDTSSAVAACGIARSKDLINWERLPDLKTASAQQRNVVLHPEFVDGKYALYTRPSDDFVEVGTQGGIGWALCDDMTNAEIGEEVIIDPKAYHTIQEVKNGQGPAPFKTDKGWLHILHGVRNCAAGLRYVLYAYLCDSDDPAKIIAKPGGHLMAPRGPERVGDVSNVLFCNGAVVKEDGTMFIYYASSDTRVHVAETTVDKMVDYCLNNAVDGMGSHKCVEIRSDMIKKNLEIMEEQGGLLTQARI